MTSDAVKMAKEALRPFSLDIRPEVPGDTMMDTLAWSADQHRAASLALAALEQAGEPVADFYYPIEMPLNADGHGPATVGEDVTTMTFEVWDQFCDSHGRFARLSDAIQRARQLNALPTLQRLDQEFDAGEAEPFAYMIRDSDGKVFWDEDHCIWTHREDAEEAAEDKGMTMFGVYDGPVPPQSRGQAFDGEGEAWDIIDMLAATFRRWIEIGADKQPHFKNGLRPWGSSELAHMADRLAALSSAKRGEG